MVFFSWSLWFMSYTFFDKFLCLSALLNVFHIMFRPFFSLSRILFFVHIFLIVLTGSKRNSTTHLSSNRSIKNLPFDIFVHSVSCDPLLSFFKKNYFHIWNHFSLNDYELVELLDEFGI